MKVYLETYGCTANKSDESIAVGILKKEHHEIVDEMEDADVLTLLTCNWNDRTTNAFKDESF